MKLLPEKRIKIAGVRDELSVSYEDITQYDILKEITSGFNIDDYKDVHIDISGEDGKVLLTVSKERLIEFLEKVELIKQREEYKEKYLTLRERVGDSAVKYLITREIIFDPDILVGYLPSKELIEEDMKLWHRTIDLSCGYYATDEGVLSLELVKKLAIGETLDEYPEKLEYHYYRYPQQFKSVCETPFTKSEFLASVKKEQDAKKLIRKK